MKIKDLILKSNGVLLNPIDLPATFHEIVTDTREMKKGDIFVALTGLHYDGHDYIEEAIQKGASAIFVEKEVTGTIPVIQVKDTKQCLMDFASLYLQTYPVFVIAVTGSVGKTTTKELIAHILSKKYRVLKSEGNKNNHIGIPQTIFHLNSNIECLVVELGMNHFHEIERLSTLVHPNIALITNIGSSHIGNLGSKKNILKAKLEILKGMDGGICILNDHDPFLRKVKKMDCGKIERVHQKRGNIQITLLEQTIYGSKIQIQNGIEQATIFFKVPGEKMLEDLALALRVGDLLDVSFEKMIEAVQEYTCMDKRLQITQLKDGNILMNDCYNSSYESLKMDLELLEKVNIHKILILGDILELGKKSRKVHKKIGNLVNQLSNTDVYFVGTEMKMAWKKNKKGSFFPTLEDLISNWKMPKEQSIILVKGSRKMKLEDFLTYLD